MDTNCVPNYIQCIDPVMLFFSSTPKQVNSVVKDSFLNFIYADVSDIVNLIFVC